MFKKINGVIAGAVLIVVLIGVLIVSNTKMTHEWLVAADEDIDINPIVNTAPLDINADEDIDINPI